MSDCVMCDGRLAGGQPHYRIIRPVAGALLVCGHCLQYEDEEQIDTARMVDPSDSDGDRSSERVAMLLASFVESEGGTAVVR